MDKPTNNLIGYFADWDTDKDTPIPALDFEGVIRSVDKVYNNILENNSNFGTHSDSNATSALIIKYIPLTIINDIQSIVYYNRSGFVTTGEVNCDYLNTTFQGKFGIPDSANDLTLSGTQINFNSASFISNSAGGNSGNHLIIFVNGTEYKIKLENVS